MTQPVTVSSERALLVAHLDWIVNQDWCDEFFADVKAVHGQLLSAHGIQKQKPVGRCYLPTDDAPTCGGPVWADSVAGHAECAWCRSTWDGSEISRLMLALDQERIEAARPRTDDGRPMMTIAEIVANFGGNANSVRVRLSRVGIKGVDGYYDVAPFEKLAA